MINNLLLQQQPGSELQRQIAQQLLQQGTNLAPVQSSGEALVRALSGLAGGYFAGQQRQADQARQQQFNQALQSGLTAAREGGGTQALVDALSGVPGAEGAAIQFGLADLQQQQQAQAAQAQADRAFKDKVRLAQITGNTAAQKEAIARAGRTEVNVDARPPGEDVATKQLAKVIGEETAKDYVQLRRDVENDQTLKPKLLSALAISQDENTYQGFGAESLLEFRKAMTGLGIKKYNTADAETLRASSREILLDVLAKQKGPQTEGDAQRALSTLFTLGGSREFNQRLIQQEINEIDARRERFDFLRPAIQNAIQTGDILSVGADATARQKPTPTALQPQGQVAVNPQTGERLVLQNGQWVPLNGR